ncbi:MAG TPA: ROK family protein [Solirubrobacteraceae bacterium]|jgi:glucokinase|nr:ROK family protein [Solirubrobacteraceae bacterium]
MPAASGTARGGIDLGGTKIEAVIVDPRSKVLGAARRPTPTTGGPRDVANEMLAALRDAAKLAGVKPAELRGVGVGAPGNVDPETGAVSNALNLPDWGGSYPLAAQLSRRLRTGVFVGNDVQVATDGEFRLGAGKPYKSVLGVFWGTGVGGGIVLDGKDWLGRGGAGEIGHTVVMLDGRRCPCGRRGCLEAYAGRAAMEARARKLMEKGAKTDLFKLMKKHDRPRLTSSIWEAAVSNGDKLAIELIDEAVHALGAGIGSAVNLLDVEAVVIGGGLGLRFGEPYVARIAEEMKPHVYVSQPDVQMASLGDQGGAIGAALLAQKARRTRASG